MVSLHCDASRVNGVTLVTGRVENAADARRVRLDATLDGPVWPPRERGVPAAGWDDDGVEIALEPRETRPVGFASPAPPSDPPLVVAESEPADDADGFDTRVPVPDVEPTPASVVRSLDDARPPRDAVPVPEVDGGHRSEGEDHRRRPTSGSAHCGSAGEPGAGDCDDECSDAGVRAGSIADTAAVDSADIGRDPPGAVANSRVTTDGGACWGTAVEDSLGTVEERIEAAERLTAETHLPEVTTALRAVGGVEGVRDLDDRLAADAERLAAIAERAESLADRAERIDVDVATIERLR